MPAGLELLEKEREVCSPEIVAGLSSLFGLEYVDDEYVNFRIGIARAQAEAIALLKKVHPRPALLDDATEAAFLALCRIAQSFFGSVKELAAGNGGDSEDLSILSTASGKDPNLIWNIVRARLCEGEFLCDSAHSVLAGINDDALAYFAHILAAPFAVFFASGSGPGFAGNSRERANGIARCPRCGSSPALAKLCRDDGRRVLYCSLCGEDFAHPRLRCPFCGIVDAASSHMFFVSAESPSWVEWCANCHNYLKLFDERRLPGTDSFIPYVGETATVHLDLMAEEDGLLRRLPYAAAR